MIPDEIKYDVALEGLVVAAAMIVAVAVPVVTIDDAFVAIASP